MPKSHPVPAGFSVVIPQRRQINPELVTAQTEDFPADTSRKPLEVFGFVSKQKKDRINT